MEKLASLTFMAGMILTSAAAQVGQLYVVAGSPTPEYGDGFSTVLAAVGSDGSLRNTQEIVPGNIGTQWTATSLDGRKAVILTRNSRNVNGSVIVLDFDTASVAKSCAHPDGTLLLGQWLIDSPTRNLVFVGYGGTKIVVTNGKATTQGETRLLGMITDPLVPCERSFIRIDASEMKHFVSDGTAGVGNEGTQVWMYISVASDGSFFSKWSKEQAYFDYRIPTTYFKDMKRPVAMVVVNNRQILGVDLMDDPDRTRQPNRDFQQDRRLVILRKSDSTWRQAPQPFIGRAFGSFVVSPEAHEKVPGMPESAGKQDWSSTETSTGTSSAARLRNHPFSYPGVLHLYDAATEKAYTIRTNQGDSEILLVENSTVYYRVGNRLYSAPITGPGIGPSKVLATDELIRDAHWAFIKR